MKAVKRMAKFRKNRTEEEKTKDDMKAMQEMAKFRENELLENPLQYRQSAAMYKAKYRQAKSSTSQGRHRIFIESVKHGPIYGCVCCHRFALKMASYP